MDDLTSSQEEIAERLGVQACADMSHDVVAHHHQQITDDSGNVVGVTFVPCRRPGGDCPPCDYYAPKFQRVDGIVDSWWDGLSPEARADLYVDENH